MNYQEYIENLIKVRCVLPGSYSEVHHIIPKCLGGSDEQSNLITLLPEEHIEAHYLLCQLYPDNSRLKYALTCMINFRKHNNFQLSEDIKAEYRKAKEFKSKSLVEYNKTRVHPLLGKTHKGGNKNRGAAHNRFGIKHTKESKDLMSQKRKGSLHPNFDSTIYHFRHINGEEFKGTRFDFRTKYNLNKRVPNRLVRGEQKTAKGWQILINNNMEK